MGRTPCDVNNGLKKGPWTPEEDEKLLHYIQQFGYGNWRTLPKNAGLDRCGKSCRLRWTNYLRPDIKRGRFSLEEEDAIIQLHSVLGNKWSTIAARLPGRTDNEIKNYWNTHIRKRLLRMGIDPVTHSPRLDLLDLSSILNPSFLNSAQSQINFSRFLGVQPRVNQKLLDLATSLLSTQNIQESQNQIPQFGQQASQYQSDIQENQDFAPFFNDAQLMEPNVEQFLTSFPNVGDIQNFDLNYWQGNEVATNAPDDYVLNLQNYDYYGLENSNLQLENGNNNQVFGYGMSNISTSISSPTPLNSNSTNVSTDDEKEINCSAVMKFEIPDFSDLNKFMYI